MYRVNWVKKKDSCADVFRKIQRTHFLYASAVF